MKYFYKSIFLLSFLLVNTNCNSSRDVLNTCGNIGYNQPQSSDECKEDGQMCCYVHITHDDGTDISFCVNSPSEIEKEDVKNEIKEYTKFTLEDIKCNKSNYLYNNMIASLLIIFILF